MVLDENPIHPGAESYLRITDEPQTNGNARAKITREFVSIDSFVMERPYTVEILIRLQSDPDYVDSLRVFSRPAHPTAPASFSWSIEVDRMTSDGVLSWVVPDYDSNSNDKDRLTVGWWESVRCMIHVDPIDGTWQAMLATADDSIEMPKQSLASPSKQLQQPVILGLEAIGRHDCKSNQFSIDEIRIQNN
ncbi:MAG: hypothetical protein ABJZ55_05635 [Fuerstiella sp.]